MHLPNKSGHIRFALLSPHKDGRRKMTSPSYSLSIHMPWSTRMHEHVCTDDKDTSTHMSWGRINKN